MLDSLNVARAQFLVNAVDTRTQGVDVTLHHAAHFGAGTLTTFLGANYNTNSITRVNPTSVLRAQGIDAFLSRRERLFIEGAAPKSKAIFSSHYRLGDWDATVKLTYFGSLTLGTFSGETVADQRYRPRTSVDLSLGYDLTDGPRALLEGRLAPSVDESDHAAAFDHEVCVPLDRSNRHGPRRPARRMCGDQDARSGMIDDVHIDRHPLAVERRVPALARAWVRRRAPGRGGSSGHGSPRFRP